MIYLLLGIVLVFSVGAVSAAVIAGISDRDLPSPQARHPKDHLDRKGSGERYFKT